MDITTSRALDARIAFGDAALQGGDLEAAVEYFDLALDQAHVGRPPASCGSGGSVDLIVVDCHLVVSSV
jgi:hypothetical protein